MDSSGKTNSEPSCSENKVRQTSVHRIDLTNCDYWQQTLQTSWTSVKYLTLLTREPKHNQLILTGHLKRTEKSKDTT